MSSSNNIDSHDDHTTNDGAVFIVDNNNENSNDSNPYAYPYFHSDGTVPLLYELVVKFSGGGGGGGTSNDRDIATTTTTTTTTGDEFVGVNDNTNSETARLVQTKKKLVRRIRSRCLVRPMEAGWADSCGENALHRLCQGVRFQSTSSSSSSCETTAAASYDELDENILVVAKALMDACPMASSARNNWGELPLHQFVSHCGIHVGGTSNDLLSVPSSSPSWHEGLAAKSSRNGNASDDDEDAPPTMQMLNLLLESFPFGVGNKNYLRGLPLHDACSLSQAEDMAHDVMRDMVRTMEELESRSVLQHRARVQHVDIVKRLMDVYPSALGKMDETMKTPLHRAVQSDRCDVGVVRALLERMEQSLLSRGGVRSLRHAVNGQPGDCSVRLGSAKFGEERVRVGSSEHSCCATKSPSPLSAMELLWDQFVSKARRITVPLPFMGNLSRTTVSSIIFACLNGNYADAARQPSSQRDVLHDHQQVAARMLARRLGPLWEKAVLLIRAAYHDSVLDPPPDESKWRLAHAAAAVGCPRCVVALAVQLYPEQLLERDEEGRTPLAIAASAKPITFDPSAGGTVSESVPRDEVRGGNVGGTTLAAGPNLLRSPGTLGEKESLVSLLLWSNANAARIPDSDGRLPLHRAITSWKNWFDDGRGGVSDIFKCEPSAVSRRDNVTGLYPFMLAAVPSGEENDAMSDAESPAAGGTKRVSPLASWSESFSPTKSPLDEACGYAARHVTTIFELLRADPSVLLLS